MDDGKESLVALWIDLFEILSAVAHLTLPRIIEPLDELDDGALTTARGTDKGYCLVSPYFNADVLDDLGVLLCRISELDVLDGDVAGFKALLVYLLASFDGYLWLVDKDTCHRSDSANSSHDVTEH